MIPNRRLPWLVVLVLAIATLVSAACGPGATEEDLKVNDNSSAARTPIPGEDAATPVPISSESTDTAKPTPTQTPSEDGNPASTPTATPSPTAEDQGPTAKPTPIIDRSYRDLKIVTLLPRDAIPAILDPTFLDAEEAWDQYLPDEPVLGVSINGEHKAYSIPYLSSREIVNDEVGGVAIAVTW